MDEMFSKLEELEVRIKQRNKNKTEKTETKEVDLSPPE